MCGTPTHAKTAAPGRTGIRTLTLLFALLVLAILLGIIVSLIYGSLPAMQKFGVGFLVTTDWNPVTESSARWCRSSERS